MGKPEEKVGSKKDLNCTLVLRNMDSCSAFRFFHIIIWFILAVIQEAWLKELIILPVTSSFSSAGFLTFSLSLFVPECLFLFYHQLFLVCEYLYPPPPPPPLSLSPPPLPFSPWLRHNNMRAEAQSLVLVTAQQWEHMALGKCACVCVWAFGSIPMYSPQENCMYCILARSITLPNLTNLLHTSIFPLPC